MDQRGTCPSRFLWALIVCACGGASSPLGSGKATQTSAGTAGGAAGTAATAAAIWAVTGCKLQGCPYGSYCDRESGLCKSQTCTEGEGCPPGTVCNEGLNRCQEIPPPKTPNDFLPQDDARHPPGMN